MPGSATEGPAGERAGPLSVGEMDKRYDPAAIEPRWYRFWEQQGYFAPAGGDGEPYCILLPPPNVTGSLHMGHGFQHTLMDILVRFERMRGKRVLWQCGTDHAGIATQMVVERRLEAAGRSRRELGREAFLQEVWRWKEQSGGRITAQMRRLGSSPDWSRERFTMDPELSRAVVEAFVRLHEQGLIYRSKSLVNWDPQLQTAISDLEVVAEEEEGRLWYFRYPLAEGSGHIVVATTRPETMLGDTAVAVNPEDPRYRQLIGKRVQLPLCDRELPVIADEHVDAEFGSGCVKITPAHDFDDYALGQRHGLEMINIFTESARLNEQVPEPFRGLDRFEARRRVVAAMDALGLLESERPHRLKVPRCDRSGEIIEPRLTDQWFLRTAELAGDAIGAVESGSLRFVPERWQNSYFSWLRDVRDWCISRQLWWGHRIPAWYDANGHCYVGRDEEELRRRHGLGDELPLRQDEDVLDTWFSSALWSFSTLGWPERTAALETWHPTSVLVTGFDIIFFWVARMVMCSGRLLGQLPFREVYVTGLVRDAQGRKMSKSKGNVLDPIDLIDGIALEALVSKRLEGLMQPQLAGSIEKQTRREFPRGIQACGADGLRFTFAALASTAQDLNFDISRMTGYRNFCTKLWNASRFVIGRCADAGDGDVRPEDTATGDVYQRWILSALQGLTGECTRFLEAYRFDLYAAALYDFIWHQYCDWYLELAKIALDGDDEAAQAATRRNAVQVLETLLRLAHPVIPFITEELWQRLKPLSRFGGESLMIAAFPIADQQLQDAAAEAELDWLKAVVTAVRTIRGEFGIPTGRSLKLWLRGDDPQQQSYWGRHQNALRVLAGVDELRWLDATESLPTAVATQLLRGVELAVPIAGLVDREAELGRLDKAIATQQRNCARDRKSLEHPGFVAKAPPQRVAELRERLAEAEKTLAGLRERQRLIEAVGD